MAGVLLLPAAQAQNAEPTVPDELLDRLSQGALIPYLKEHPEQAPGDLGERLQVVERAAERVSQQTSPTALAPPGGVGVQFNRDSRGLPQNEESVTACTTQGGTDVVLGGTNDFRGLFNAQGDFSPGNSTGWHFSDDGGASLHSEGLLPAVRIGQRFVPSGGDPVVASDASCNLYAASLAFDEEEFASSSGIAVYRTTPEILADCQGAACWPTRRAVASAGAGPRSFHFLDKEWMYVGSNGSGGTVVWTVYTDFGFTFTPTGEEATSAIKAVRCRADLSRCTKPISLSGNIRDPNRFVQFGDVTVAPDGRTFVTWTEFQFSFRTGALRSTHKLRVSAPGNTTFGPTRTVAVENQAITSLNANDHPVATYPKNEVRMVGGRPKVFVVWDACGARPEPFVCERPIVKLKSSEDLGKTWSETTVVSEAGANYFSTIANDASGPNLAIAYFTSREDARFDNRQDIELVTLDPQTSQVLKRQLLTSESNEPEADPLLGGFFIGDYIEVYAAGGEAFIHYNANYRQIQLLGKGLPIAQQDNFLIRADL